MLSTARRRLFSTLRNRPVLQFAGDMQHLPPFLQQHLSAGVKRAMAAAVEQLNIEIAFVR